MCIDACLRALRGDLLKKELVNQRSAYVGLQKQGAEKRGTCQAENVKDEVIRQAVMTAWNAVVKERDKLIGPWETMQKSGNPLQALRARQMIEITAHTQGPIKWEIPELTRTVLERIVIHDKRHFTIRFLDGTMKEVIITE